MGMATGSSACIHPAYDFKTLTRQEASAEFGQVSRIHQLAELPALQDEQRYQVLLSRRYRRNQGSRMGYLFGVFVFEVASTFNAPLSRSGGLAGVDARPPGEGRWHD